MITAARAGQAGERKIIGIFAAIPLDLNPAIDRDKTSWPTSTVIPLTSEPG